VFSEAKWKALRARLGPDPLREDANLTTAFALIEKRNTPIGLLLMDQSVIAGIGNIFRAELLYRAGINPDRPGKEVGLPALRGIWKDARALMKKAMEAPPHRDDEVERQVAPAGSGAG
ncbi:MAG: hypothetical protein WAK33_24020, partial [Silvibacterium sp.]